MKNFLQFSLVLLLFSCANETSVEEGKTLIKDSIIEEPINEDSIPHENLAVNENPLTIEDFPKKWFKLDKQGEGFVINEYCEAETQQLSIEYQKELGWRVLVSYGQDATWYKVIEFDAYEETRENFEVMYGSFILENPDYPDMDVEIYDFMWNKDLQFATFGGFFQDETRMVSKQNKDNYELVKENCDYLDDM